MESVRNDLYEILSRNSNIPFDKIVQMCENGDYFMKSDEAIAHGFIDNVIGKKS